MRRNLLFVLMNTASEPVLSSVEGCRKLLSCLRARLQISLRFLVSQFEFTDGLHRRWTLACSTMFGATKRLRFWPGRIWIGGCLCLLQTNLSIVIWNHSTSLFAACARSRQAWLKRNRVYSNSRKTMSAIPTSSKCLESGEQTLWNISSEFTVSQTKHYWFLLMR